MVLCFCETLLWVLAVFIVLAFSFYTYTTWNHNSLRKLGIPGPKPGFLGEILKFSTQVIGEVDLELHRKYGKVCGYYMGRSPVVSVADPDLIKEVCVKHFHRFANRPMSIPVDKYEKGFLTVVNGAKWKFSRAILSPTFSSSKLREMMPLMKQCTQNLVKHLKICQESGESINAKKFMNGYTLDVICRVALGVDVDSQNQPDSSLVQACVKAMDVNFKNPIILSCIALPFLVPILQKLGVGFIDRGAKACLDELIQDIVKERRINPSKRQDFLQLMINANNKTKNNEEDKAFTEYDIWSGAVIFLLAGYDTTSTTLAFAMFCIATNQDVQDKVVEEINTVFKKDEEPDYDNVSQLHYLQMVVDESLRLYPPGSRTSRVALEDTELNGYKIMKGCEVMVPIYAIHRDPEYWEDPEKFDPNRFSPENKASRHPYCYLPFGAGPRNCIGMRWALMEVKSVLVNILRTYRVICAPETEKPILTLASGDPFTTAKNGIWIRLEKRSN